MERLDFFDQLHLRAVGSLDKAHTPAVVGRHFFKDFDTVLAHAGECPVIVIGIDGDVFDAIMLLVALARDQGGDVELQPMQVEAEAAAVGARVRAGCQQMADPAPDSMFDDVLTAETPQLAAQRAEFAAYLDSFVAEEAAR